MRLKHLLFLAAIPVMAAFPVNAADLPANSVYTAITSTQSYSKYVGPTPIGGLSVTLPPANALYNTAIVTLSMPNLFLSDPTSTTVPMAADIQLVAPFSPAGVISAFGGIGCDTATVKTSGKKPISIVIRVPLGTSSQFAEGEWDATSGTVNTETFASISAILVKE